MIKYIPNVDVPEGKQGDWEIKKIEVEDDFWYKIALAKGRGRGVPIGIYTKLTYKGQMVMSDTPDEKRDHSYAVIKARGTVLIAGLGLGMVLNACALKPDVNRIVVVEKSQDVIDLVASHYKEKFGDLIKIICADIFEWKPERGSYFDVAWYDIWNNLCTDNLPEMTRLHRKFGKKVGWQGSWGKEILLSRRGRSLGI